MKKAQKTTGRIQPIEHLTEQEQPAGREVRTKMHAPLAGSGHGFDPSVGAKPSTHGYSRKAWLEELEERLAEARRDGRPV